MSKTITVEHKVAFNKDWPTACYAEEDIEGYYTSCSYLAYRDRTHGSKAPVERHLPKCALFNEWLEKGFKGPMKCDACLKACGLKKEE